MGVGQRGQGVSRSHTAAIRARGVGGPWQAPQPVCLAGSQPWALELRPCTPELHFLSNEEKTGGRPRKAGLEVSMPVCVSCASYACI